MTILEHYQKLFEAGLTPNDHYILLCIKEGVDYPPLGEIATLHEKGYIEDDRLTEKGKALFTETKSQKLIDFVREYRELWPAMKLPSGQYARAGERDLLDHFKTFFRRYKYSMDEVIQATKNYIQEYEDKHYEYMKNSYYFVGKKGEPSLLAQYCEGLTQQDDESLSYLGGTIL